MPKELKWTKEKPEDGLYYVRIKGKVLKVDVYNSYFVVSDEFGGAYLSNKVFDNADWAGPILESEE